LFVFQNDQTQSNLITTISRKELLTTYISKWTTFDYNNLSIKQVYDLAQTGIKNFPEIKFAKYLADNKITKWDKTILTLFKHFQLTYPLQQQLWFHKQNQTIAIQFDPFHIKKWTKDDALIYLAKLHKATTTQHKDITTYTITPQLTQPIQLELREQLQQLMTTFHIQCDQTYIEDEYLTLVCQNQTYQLLNTEVITIDLSIQQQHKIQKREFTKPWNPLSILGELAEQCCGVVSTRSLSALITNDKEINEFLNKSRKMWNQTDLELMKQRTDTLRIEKYIKSEIKTVKQNAITAFSKVKNIQDLVAEIMITLNMYDKSFHTLETTQIYNVRNITALACANSMLSELAVPKDVLEQHLIELINNMRKETTNYKLVFSIREIAEYYKHKLVDCVYTKKTLLLTIKIPIVKNTAAYSIQTLTVIPFKINNFICILNNIPRNIIVDKHSNTVVSLEQVMDPNCQDGSDQVLCKMPPVDTHFRDNKDCLYHLIFSHNWENIINTCQHQCFENRIIYLQTAPSEYLITGVDDLRISCLNGGIEDFTLTQGTIHAKIPCACQVLHKLQKTDRYILLFTSEFPCKNKIKKLQLTYYIPMTMMHKNPAITMASVRKQAQIMFPNSTAFFETLKTSLWNTSVLNLSQVSEEYNKTFKDFMERGIPKIFGFRVPNYNTILWIWVIIMTIIMIIDYGCRLFQHGKDLLGKKLAGALTATTTAEIHNLRVNYTDDKLMESLLDSEAKHPIVKNRVNINKEFSKKQNKCLNTINDTGRNVRPSVLFSPIKNKVTFEETSL
jgi:hypothetical protein